MKLSKNAVRRFAYVYLQTGDPDCAAEAIGKRDGIAILTQPEIAEELQRQRFATSGQVSREESLRRLAQLAFGRANDCVRLALGEETNIASLDLSLLAEIKRSDKGAVEIKLIDRLEAIDRLLESAGERNGAAEFLRALSDETPQGCDCACKA